MSFSAWFTKVLELNDYESLLMFPTQYMDSEEKRLILRCKDYHKTYGSLPTKKTLINEVPNANLMIDKIVSDEDVQKLLAEAKRQNFERLSSQLLLQENEKEIKDFIGVSKEIDYLSSFLSNRSFDTVRDNNLYKIPESRYNFKYEQVNNTLHSLLDGEICLFVGPEKSGKSWILIDLAFDAAYNQDKTVYIASAEMSTKELKQRLNAMAGEFNPAFFRYASQEQLDEKKELVDKRFDELNFKTKGKIVLPESHISTVDDLFADIQDLKPDMVFIDSLYMLFENGKPIMQDWTALATVIGRLKNYASKNMIQIIGNTQAKSSDFNDGLESKDIAFGRSLAQTSDVVIGVRSDTQDKNKKWLNIIVVRGTGSEMNCSLIFNWDKCEIKEHLPLNMKKFKDK